MTRVDVTIVHPLDPTNLGLGGFDTCIGDFIANAPADWTIEVLGATSNPKARPVGQRQIVQLGEHTVQFLPAMADAEPDRVRPIPLALRFALAARLRRLRPSGDVVQFHRFESVFALSGSRPTSRRVVYLHNDPTRLIGRGGDVRWRGLDIIYWTLLARALSDIEAVYAVDAGSRSSLVKRHPWLSGRVHHLPVWADPRVFQPLREADSPPDEEALPQFPATAPVLIYAGRFENQKNLGLMLRAVAACHSMGRVCGLLLVGKGREEVHLRRMADKLGISAWVRLQPPVARSQLASLYRASDVAVCSSHFESGPRHMLESLACGTPIASTAVGQVPEILAAFPAVGSLALAHEPRALARAIIRTLDFTSSDTKDQCLRAANKYDPVRILAPVYERYGRWLAAKAASVAG